MIEQEESSQLLAGYFIHVKSELEPANCPTYVTLRPLIPSRDYWVQKVLKEFHHLELIISCRQVHLAFLLEVTQQDAGAGVHQCDLIWLSETFPRNRNNLLRSTEPTEPLLSVPSVCRLAMVDWRRNFLGQMWDVRTSVIEGQQRSVKSDMLTLWSNGIEALCPMMSMRWQTRWKWSRNLRWYQSYRSDISLRKCLTMQI